MSPLTFYIVYHKILHEENTNDFSEELKNSILMWVAVNEEIEKEYPSWINNRLIKEWEMPQHSPLYQMLHWQQNSFFHHLYLNRHSISTKYVGFGQYDQKLASGPFTHLVNLIENDTADKLIGCYVCPFEVILDLFKEPEWEEVFIKPYNEFYKLNHKLQDFKDKPMMLLHTFIIPTWFFNHMMPFIEYVTPIITRKLKWNIRHLAGTFERLYALCLAAGIIEGKFRSVHAFAGVIQCDSQRTPDPIRGLQ
jgi:hypothetical protein